VIDPSLLRAERASVRWSEFGLPVAVVGEDGGVRVEPALSHRQMDIVAR
jgi:hypothetical protein